jgi:diguanylate cyclase (GGDEF)-like protein
MTSLKLVERGALDEMVEQDRLAELSCYAIRAEHADPKLDTLTEVAVKAVGGDIGGISLIHRSEIWLPSRVGIDVTSVPRAGSFCTCAIASGSDALFEIEDARADPRFAGNALVNGATPFLHYAAAPLLGTRGFMLGTLWMMRHAPGRLSADQAFLFRGMAKLAVEALELRYSNDVTGMSNRFSFLRHLQSELERADPAPLVVGHVDLIAFRQINDVFGREQGNEALRLIGKRLCGWAGAHNLVAHLGGVKFAFALLGEAHEATERIERLAAQLSEPIVLPEHSAQSVHARIGIVRHPAHGAATAAGLLEAADTAASSISASVHHTTVRVFDAELRARSHALHELGGVLDGDAACGALQAHYQPQVDVASGTLIGLEALVRWQHPLKGLLLPSAFIGLAESTGKIYRLDLLVFDLVCRDLRRWLDAGLDPVPVSFNFSRSSLLHRNVIADVRRVLNTHAVDAALLELEITETQLPDNFSPLWRCVAEFRQLGMRIAIDDFGTGHSNLDAINSFPFDRLKVDRQFVHGVARDARCAGMFELISGIAELFKAELICEGLEDADDLAWLVARGVVRIQGWYFSAARPAADIVQILTALRARPVHGPALNSSQLRQLLAPARALASAEAL